MLSEAKSRAFGKRSEISSIREAKRNLEHSGSEAKSRAFGIVFR